MPCRLCNSPFTPQQFTVRENMFQTGQTFIYRRCSACGCLQIEEYPADPGKYYPEKYYSFGRWANPRSLKERMKHQRNSWIWFRRNPLGMMLNWFLPNHFLSTLRSLPGISYNTTILDIGCGYGEQLLSLQRLGFRNLTGIDPFNPDDFQPAQGLNIYKKHYHEVNQTYDLIMMHHVLEHMPDQRRIFQWVSEHLNRDGYLILRIPMSDSLVFERYGINWVQWDAPRHWYLHTRNSLAFLAQSFGFDIIKLRYDSNGMQFWGSELYKRGLPLFDQDGKPTNLLKHFSPFRLLWYNRYAAYLNRRGRSDQAVIVFRKKPQEPK